MKQLRGVPAAESQLTAPDADEAAALIRAAADTVEISGRLRVVSDDPRNGTWHHRGSLRLQSKRSVLSGGPSFPGRRRDLLSALV
jgi:hypothetical protein